MKERLVISFSLIFLFSITFISAGFFGDLFRTTGRSIGDDGWTKWYDRDNPNGNGDFENLRYQRNENPGKICNNPTKVECRTTTGLDYTQTGENVVCGLGENDQRCINTDQSDGKCDYDYEVRFYCGSIDDPTEPIPKPTTPISPIKNTTNVTIDPPTEPAPAPNITNTTNKTVEPSVKSTIINSKIGYLEGKTDLETIEKSEKIKELISDLIDLNDKYSETPPFFFFKKGKISRELNELAKERKERLIKLMEENPSAFLQHVISNQERGSFPKKVRDHIEQKKGT